MSATIGKRGRDFIGVGVGAVIINEKDEILLLHRRFAPEAGFWTIPGGAVEWFETCEQAIKRECYEEIRAQIRVEKLLTVVDHIVREESIHWVSTEYLVELLTPVEQLEFSTRENQAMQWFNINALPDKITKTTRTAVESYLLYRKNNFRSE